MPKTTAKRTGAIAIVGMAGRFPGARNLTEFWSNLRDGVDSLSHFSHQELVRAGVDERSLDNPAYVKAGSFLERAEEFDAAFFGVNPREAEAMDPQHRVFLECAWEALEDAAYDSETYGGAIGVFAGCSMNSYGISNILANGEFLATVGGYQAMIGNDKDFLTTRVSYKLNLRGPSISVQTACSTSLVAVQLACQSLLAHQCDMALTGGVSISFPQKAGYLYQENMIFSPDGKCRPFDANGRGIRAGEGAAVVVLKRLADALSDGDNIHAIVLGSAVNNDGSLKIGYTAPSVDGQAEVIATAMAMADVDPESITYIEAHGTATPVGDPIEVAALTKAFRASTARKQFCAIGSLKSNIGHLDAAAGVAGLIKAVLALKNKQIPPSLHFESPNAQINFQESPFYVNTRLTEWQSNEIPRRAGVSSFGIGGTNAHVVLEEAPLGSPSPDGRPYHALILSAKTPKALDEATQNLALWLKENPSAELADVAYTLQVGRRPFEYRRSIVCKDIADAWKSLESGDLRRIYTAQVTSARKKVAFMFTGQGSQYVNMAAGVYQTERVFRDCLDECANLLEPRLGLDLRSVLYLASTERRKEESAASLDQTWLTQPALFAVEYSLAKLWMSWGVEPQTMIGHSVGEYVAACLAGVFSLPDALSLVAVRGRLMQELPAGAMLAVSLSDADLRGRLQGSLSLAAINGPSLCVASGPIEAIDALEKNLERDGVLCQRLHTSHAFHSDMMERAVKPLVEHVTAVQRKAPAIPFLSNVTGKWISAAEATDPAYWGRHLRATVQFAAGLAELGRSQEQVFLEVGPGHTLKSLAKRSLPGIPEDRVLSSLPHPHETHADEMFLLTSVCRLWLAGVAVSWPRLHADSRRRRVSLPAYPFERHRFFVERKSAESAASGPKLPANLSKRKNVADWFWQYSWKRSVPLSLLQPQLDADRSPRWLVFLDRCGIGRAIVEQLGKQGLQAVTVETGSAFARVSENSYVIAPGNRPDYERLVKDIFSSRQSLNRILHLWNVSPRVPVDGGAALREIEIAKDLSFYSLLYLVQALANAGEEIDQERDILIVSNGMQEIVGKDGWSPEKALLLGPCKVLPREHEHCHARSLDIELEGESPDELASAVLGEATGDFADIIVAFRGGYRWAQDVAQVRWKPASNPQSYLRPGGTYLITGGLGGLGLTFARHFAQAAKARLILTSRTGLPPESGWNDWLESHDPGDGISVKIRSVQELIKLGADVMVSDADSADEEQMRRVMVEATDRFGPVRGVIHTAGLTMAGPMQSKTRETAEAILRPKLEGTLVLERLLAGTDLDFFGLCSSVNALYGYLGNVDYCAANVYLDAFALSRKGNGCGPIVSIGWDSWQEVGMMANAVVPEQLKKAREKFLQLAITPEEGTAALDRVLAIPLAQVMVVTQDLAALTEQMNVFVSPLRSQEELIPAVGKPVGSQIAKSGHSRPDLGSAYVAPRTPQEQTLVDIWSELLGVNNVGVADNFFDLGGHSLLATRVLSRVQDLFRIRMPPRTIFEAPTVAEFADRLRTYVWAAETGDSATSDAEQDREEIEL